MPSETPPASHGTTSHGTAAVADDAVADDAVVSTLRASLERVVRRTCPPWLLARRDDLVQAAVIKVIEVREKSGEGIGDVPSSYLYRVAHSALVDEIRRHRRKREVALEEGGTTVEQPERVLDPEQEAASRQMGEAIRDCLSRLKQERKWAVALYLQGSNVPESSVLLGWDRKRTENLVFRGLAELRQCLTKKGFRP